MRSGGFAAVVAADLAVIHAFGEALAGTGKPLVGVGHRSRPGTSPPATEEAPEEERALRGP